MPNSRSYTDPTYSHRYGFNGMVEDNELKGEGNSLDFGARFYDPRVGRFLSLDPSLAKYPNLSPYVAFADNPIMFVDPDGRVVRIAPNITNAIDLKDLEETIKVVSRTAVFKMLNERALSLENKPVLPDDPNYISELIQEKMASSFYIDVTIEFKNIDNDLESKSDRYITQKVGNSIRMLNCTIQDGNVTPDYTYFFNAKDYMKNVTNNLKNYFANPDVPTQDEISNIINEITQLAKGQEQSSAVPIMISKGAIVIDDAPEQSLSKVLAHELGGFLGSIKEPAKDWIYNVLMPAVTGNKNWNKGGHYPSDNPHAVGAEEGEKQL